MESLAPFLIVLLGVPPATTAKGTEARTTATALGTRLPWNGHGGPRLLWTGFRLKPNGGEVVVQTSGEVELESRTGKDGPLFLLKHCRIVRRTDRLPLDTRYFDSPVTGVSLRERAGDLEIAVTLRAPVAPAPRKEPGPGGSWFWVLEFPAPAADRAPTAANP